MKGLQFSRARSVLMDALEQGASRFQQLATVVGQNLCGPPMRVCRVEQQRQTGVNRRLSRNGLPLDIARSRARPPGSRLTG